ncbi:MAG: hypothetical protein PHE24_06745 [Patescibacteria group bacterium]|nr:hypothetical protein [Patescibacteria group bacterium]
MKSNSSSTDPCSLSRSLGNAGIFFVDGMEAVVDDADRVTILDDINVESDGASPWYTMVNQILRSGKKIRGEVQDDVPEPPQYALETIAKANRKRQNRSYRRMVNNLFRDMDSITDGARIFTPKNTRQLSCVAA